MEGGFTLGPETRLGGCLLGASHLLALGERHPCLQILKSLLGPGDPGGQRPLFLRLSGSWQRDRVRAAHEPGVVTLLATAQGHVYRTARDAHFVKGSVVY